MKEFSKILVCALLILGSTQAQAQNSNQDYLIEKLERLHMNLAPNDPSRSAVTLRLADLLSERARQNTVLEAEGKCEKCPSVTADRNKALKNYIAVLNTLSVDKKSIVLVQMGHLYQLLGNPPKAIESYSKLTQPEYTSTARAEAYLSIAEIYFKRSDWKQAEINYLKSIAENQTNPGSKGFATYKLGWSLFNLGQVSEAKAKLLSVLQTPAFLSKSGASEAVVDVAFKEQVARDYSEIAGRAYQSSDLKHIYELSPENKKLDNLYTIASELERTGKKTDALEAWNYLYQYQAKPEDRALTKAHLGAVYIQMSKGKEAGEQFEEAFNLVSAVKKEKNVDFEDARRLIRSTIVTWNQAEKKNPSQELLNTYVGYLNNFKFEKEMNVWAVTIASDLKEWDTAWKLQQQALTEVSKVEQGGKLYEQQLLQGIELAELSKDPAMLLKAQDQYLELSQLKTKYWEVTYQKAYVAYEKAENEKFLTAFTEIIDSEKAPAGIRLKTADLYLDYLAAKKRDSDIVIKGKEFHTKLSKLNGYDGSYNRLSQKAILNEVVREHNENKLDNAWALLEQFQVRAADEKDVVIYYKNKMAIAEKRKDIDSAVTAAQSLKAIKNLPAEDQTLATAKLAYYADLKLDFKSALAETAKLPNSILAEDKKNLKLALYSDLLGQNSQSYLEKFIAASADKTTKQAAIYELVRTSDANDTLLKKYEKDLTSQKDFISDLATLSYIKGKSASYGFSLYNKNKDIKTTAGGMAILRDQTLLALNSQAESLKKMTLPMDASAKNYQNILARDMKARIAALNKLDQLAAASIQSKDWTLQTVALTIVGTESDRFYNEIMSLPMPEGLTPAEQGEYMSILSEQASPFKMKAEQAQVKSKEFWAEAKAYEALQTRLNGDYAALAQDEKTILTKFATDDAAKNQIAALTARAVDTENLKVADSKIMPVNDKDIIAARAQVKSNPFSLDFLTHLKDLELQKGNRAMVQYLETRINELKNPSKSDEQNLNKEVK